MYTPIDVLVWQAFVIKHPVKKDTYYELHIHVLYEIKKYQFICF